MDKTELLVTCGLISLILFGLGLHGYNHQKAMVHPVLLHGEDGEEGFGSIVDVREATAELKISRPSTGYERKDINHASAEDLRAVHGIGESISQSIIDYRNENGPFASMEDVMKVPGIGAARLGEIARLFTVMNAISGVQSEQETQDAPAETKPAENGKVNVNTASAEELQKLPGIGPVLSQQIVDYRREHGYFQSRNDLLSVPGIGEVRLSSILKHIEPLPGLDNVKFVDARPSRPIRGVVNINLASAQELMTLPGIGQTYARRIIEDRKRRGAFKSVDDLQRVTGIGPQRLEQIREMISAD